MPPGSDSRACDPEDFAVYAGVFPEDKYRLVKALQAGRHVVAMCGDGANDAPALRQAQMGIAVSSATDVAKSAASAVLMEPGLAGIVTAIEEGRRTFQRILTYTLNALVKKFELVLFLGAGLLISGHAILTPMLMALLLITGDFLTMSLTTIVRPHRRRLIGGEWGVYGGGRGPGSDWPDIRRQRRGDRQIRLGPQYCRAANARLHHPGVRRPGPVLVIRERRHFWHSMPGFWLVTSSLADLLIAGTLAWTGTLMAPLAASRIAAVFVATLLFALILEGVKHQSFRVLRIA